MNIAVAMTAMAIFVAPFRSSAGTRAGLLLIAFLMLCFVGWKNRCKLLLIPHGFILRRAVVAWVLTILFFVVIAVDWRTSAESWRGDVLTPILAAIIFYTLGHSMRALGAWLVTLLVGLLILLGMLVVEPFQPGIGTYAPKYIGVGWLSTWIVMLSALLPLSWLVPWPKPQLAMTLGALALLAILVVGWLSANRIVWVCFGAMFLIYAVINFRASSDKAFLHWSKIGAGILLFTMLFFASTVARTKYYPEVQTGALAMMSQDHRPLIWQAALTTIEARPFLGHGYASKEAQNALLSNYTIPEFRDAYKQAHNFLLNMAIETGVVGVSMCLLLFFAMFYAFWSRRQSSPVQRAIASCGMMLVAGFFLRNMTDDFFSRHAALLFGALIGMLLARCDDIALPVDTRSRDAMINDKTI
jgi:O-antigen ligase